MSFLSSVSNFFRNPAATETASTQVPPAFPEPFGGHARGGFLGSSICDHLLKPQEPPLWAGSPFDIFAQPLRQTPVITPPPISTLVADLKKWEGVEFHMYQDKKGLVTTGIGNLLPTAAAAKKLPWTDMATGLPATPKQIDKAFAEVAGAPTGGKAGAFAGLSTLRLDPGVVNNLAAQRLENEFLPGLRKQFQHFDNYPQPAQRALVDMAYSLGMGGLAKFKDLHAACEAGDFAAAADKCHRKGGREERNDWTSDLFAQASRLTAPVG